MTPIKNFLFAQNAESKNDFVETPLMNNRGDSITVEIWGDFTSGEFVFEGKTDINNPNYTPILGLNLSTREALSKVTDAGIYTIIGAEGLQVFRVRCNSLSGGAVTVLARNVSTGA